jgi:hypothetical protein
MPAAADGGVSVFVDAESAIKQSSRSDSAVADRVDRERRRRRKGRRGTGRRSAHALSSLSTERSKSPFHLFWRHLQIWAGVFQAVAVPIACFD